MEVTVVCLVPNLKHVMMAGVTGSMEFAPPVTNLQKHQSVEMQLAQKELGGYFVNKHVPQTAGTVYVFARPVFVKIA